MTSSPSMWSRRDWLVAAGATLAVGAGGGYLSMRHQRDTPRPRHVPVGEGWPWARVAWITDLHLPRSRAAVAHVAAAVAAWQPEVTLLTGDVVDHQSGLEHLADLLPLLRGTHHTIAAMGNWEYAAGLSPAALATWYGQRGIELARNARVDVGEAQVVVLDDLRLGAPAWPTGLRDRPTLWVAHEPATWRALAATTPRQPPMLRLSGHTHGGQIAVLGRPLVLPHGSDGYARGWYRDPRGGAPLVVSAGVGASSIPVRWGVDPEWGQLVPGSPPAALQRPREQHGTNPVWS